MIDRRTAIVSVAGAVGAGLAIGKTRQALGSMPATGDVALTGAEATRPLSLPALAPIKQVTAAQVPMGGGGFVTGLDASADGSRLACRTDVANGYVRDRGATSWRPLFSPSSLVHETFPPFPAMSDKVDKQGVGAIRIAPSNRDVIYATYYGFVWRSGDGGRSIERCSLPQKKIFTNAGEQRLANRALDVSPTDDRVVMVGTFGEGAWFSLDAGRRWARAPLPDSKPALDGTPGLYLILFDPRIKDRVYVFVTGVGLCRSDNGPSGPYSLVSNSPTQCYALVAGFDGDVLLGEYSKTGTGMFWRLTSGGWSSVKANGNDVRSIAVNPRRKGHLIVTDVFGALSESVDGGKTLQPLERGKRLRGGEVGWISELTWIVPSEIRFAPDDPATVYVADGVGVSQLKLDGRNVTDMSAGIEELCVTAVIVPPGGKPIVSTWDRAFWRIEAESRYVNTYQHPVADGGQRKPDAIIHGWMCDYAANDSKVLIGVINPGDQITSGYSKDGGRSWHNFRGAPDGGFGMGGSIAASTTENFILLSSNNEGGWFTLDGGSSWQPIKLDGVTPTKGFSNAYYVERKNISADKMRPHTFAIVYTVLDGGVENPLGGVWITRDGGRSWNRSFKGLIKPSSSDPASIRLAKSEFRQFWQCQLSYVPQQAGHLVYTPHADLPDDGFFWSDDDGTTWRELGSGIRNVVSFGFGKSAPGMNQPALYFFGEVNKRLGLYASFDFFASEPVLLTRTPLQILSNVSAIAGDPDAFGAVYVGTSCAGVTKIQFTR